MMQKGGDCTRVEIDEAQSKFIVAIYFYKQFHSPQCWRTADEAREFFSLESER